jgi:hypothetical protein
MGLLNNPSPPVYSVAYLKALLDRLLKPGKRGPKKEKEE